MLPEQMNTFQWSADIDLLVLLINICLGAILSGVLRVHYKKFGSVLSNRDELGHIFPMITITIILIISIVKSSLALSLGLVGALSIVRFRTPIKEPEELGYLFVCIAIGLGLGADQKEATILCFAVLTAVMTLVKWKRQTLDSKNLHLNVRWTKEAGEQGVLKGLTTILDEHTSMVHLRRFDTHDGNSQANFVVDLKETCDLDTMVSAIEGRYKNVGIVFFDQKNMPAL